MPLECYIGEITLCAFNYAPRGWAFCEGQILPISQNTALFSLLGITYGGNGRTTFALPDLRGRVPIGAGQGPGLNHYPLGQPGGMEEQDLVPWLAVPGADDPVQLQTLPSVDDKKQPYLALRYVIALQGVYPSRW